MGGARRTAPMGGARASAAAFAAMVVGLACAASLGPAPRPPARLDAPRPPVLICAHRGNGAGEPENSLAAIRGAAALGARIVEVDVRATRDGALVLMHDPLTVRTASGPIAWVSSMSFAEFRRLRLRDAPEIAPPTLADALEAARGVTSLQIDMKTDRADLVARAIAAADAHAFATCGSHDLDVLRALRRIDPRIRVIPRVARPADLAAMLVPEIAPAAVEVPPPLLAPATVARIRAAGALVWANALGSADRAAERGDPAGYLALVEKGADIIQTDRPDLLRRVVGEPARGASGWAQLARD